MTTRSSNRAFFTRSQKRALNSQRRFFLKKAALTGGLLPLWALNRQWSKLSSASSWDQLQGHARAQGGSDQPKRLIQILLSGGWDSALATDPVRGNKSADGVSYDTAYASVEQFSVVGKENLHVGAGLEEALPAFQSVPTCFVNGLFVEVTAHELAVNFMLSGQLSLSRSREYPALVARMGNAAGTFPPHITLGSPVPLGTTRDTNPPLHAAELRSLNSMLSGPRSSNSSDDPIMNDASVEITDALIERLNGLRYSPEQRQSASNLRIWSQAENRLSEIYNPRYDRTIGLEDNSQIRTDYGLPATESFDTMPAFLAGAFQVIHSGLSPYITVNTGAFDTHRSHLSTHLPPLTEFARGLKQLISDLQTHDDPSGNGQKLIETTTVLVTSEFVRTPLFNSAGGTDHWQSGSAILMGRGIRDNTVIGRTGTRGEALGWSQGEGSVRTEQNTITPEHLGATLLTHLGFPEEASELGVEPLAEITEG